MCLGAIAHLGVPLEYLTEQLNRMGIAEEYRLRVETVHRNGQQATKVYVDLLSTPGKTPSGTTKSGSTDDHVSPAHAHSVTDLALSTGLLDQHSHLPHASHTRHSHGTGLIRNLPAIEQLILAANFPARVEAWSLAVFRRLAEAEAAVHGVPVEQVHFHEVGATDAIVDIVGTCLGLDWLGIDKLYCSAIPTGGGTVWAAHGRLPVPAPAVLKLFELRQVLLYSNGIERELVTPTGAAIATTLSTQFGPPPTMVLHRVGLGAGSHNLPIPNILRLWVGERKMDAIAEFTERERQGKSRSHSSAPTVPVSIDTAPGLNPTVPVLTDTVPSLNGTVPVSNDTVPVSNGTVPVSNDTVPVSNGTVPVSNDMVPVSNDTVPVSNSTIASSAPTDPVSTRTVPSSTPIASPLTAIAPAASSASPPPISASPNVASSRFPMFNSRNSLDQIAVLETQIDDLNPQAIGYVLEALLNAGALDVFTQAIAMKKSRPGILLNVICRPDDIAVCEAIVFRETTTLGIRRSMQQRRILQRDMHLVKTDYGEIRVKVAWAERGDRVPMNVQPEYEDCAQIARQKNVPWREIHRLALQTWYQQHK